MWKIDVLSELMINQNSCILIISHLNLKIKSIFCAYVCLLYLKREIRTVRAKNVEKNIQKIWNRESWKVPFANQPDREQANPLKPDRICDDAGKNIDQCDRRQISAIISCLLLLSSILSIFGESKNMASWPKPLPCYLWRPRAAFFC